MNKYMVISGAARFVEGNLELTPDQAAPRKHNLKDLGNQIYQIMNEVEFKAGEVIGFDGQPSKAMQEVLEPEQPLEVKPLKKVKEL